MDARIQAETKCLQPVSRHLFVLSVCYHWVVFTWVVCCYARAHTGSPACLRERHAYACRTVTFCDLKLMSIDVQEYS